MKIAPGETAFVPVNYTRPLTASRHYVSCNGGDCKIERYDQEHELQEVFGSPLEDGDEKEILTASYGDSDGKHYGEVLVTADAGNAEDIVFSCARITDNRVSR